MTMKYTNAQMAEMIGSLEKYLDRTDMVGYAAARNTRALMDEAKEFVDRRNQLVSEYGEMVLDEDGNPTGKVTLALDSPNFKAFADAIEGWASIEHEPRIFKVKYDQVIGKLSGTEILELEWMLED